MYYHAVGNCKNKVVIIKNILYYKTHCYKLKTPYFIGVLKIITKIYTNYAIKN